MMDIVDKYWAMAEYLRQVAEDIDESLADERPIPDRWTIRELICHLADAEILYVDRIKRVLVEDNPQFLAADPDAFQRVLINPGRTIANEVALVVALRRHMATIVRAQDPAVLQRRCHHSWHGSMTLESLLQRAIEHIPHHVRFLREKIDLLRR